MPGRMTLPRNYVVAKLNERAVSHRLPVHRQRVVGHPMTGPQPARPGPSTGQLPGRDRNPRAVPAPGIARARHRRLADARLLNLYEAVPTGAD